MDFFMSHLLLCSMILCIITCSFILLRKLLEKTLSKLLYYYLWLVLMGLFAMPFVSLIPCFRFPSLSWNTCFRRTSAFVDRISGQTATQTPVSTATAWMKDFAVSVHRPDFALLLNILFFIWAAGVLAVAVYLIRSACLLRTLHRMSRPLPYNKTTVIFQSCLKELRIRRSIPVYTVDSLHSPAMTGVLHPRIYLPADFLSDDSETNLRYVLLHELYHYRHKDPLIHFLMNILTALYWFHPCIWIILRNMRSDRELACDASVLNHLDEDACHAYGLILLSFAQKRTSEAFPFISELSGTKYQIQKRISLITSYRKMTVQKKCQSLALFILTAILLSTFIPLLSSDVSKADASIDSFEISDTSDFDPGNYFDNYEGCFLLYDIDSETMTIYNESQTDNRVSPDSTYKIYDALFALDQGIIHPEHSYLSWSGEPYPFPEWNQDQTLQSAMAASVNWYFQSLDTRMGADTIHTYLKRIGYGNETVTGDLKSYWMESSLKISPSEQLSLLISFYRNDWGFAPEHVKAVKNALCLSSSSDASLYGKTGTGQIDGINQNGWFVGFVETSDHTYFFVTNIQGNGASGSAAASITLSILSDKGIYSS